MRFSDPRPLTIAFLLAGASGLAACRSGAADVTGLRVAVTFPGGACDQLEFTVTTANGTVVPPTARPTPAADQLTSPQTISIYLPDALADQPVTCAVTALLAGARTESGAGTATLQRGRLVRLDVPLSAAPERDASTTGDAEPDGRSLKGPGQPCATGDQCDTTLCVDGVCCASACGDLCQACNVPGKEGTCAPVPSGTVSGLCAQQPASGCGFDGTCDGNGGCRRYPAGFACKPATCAGPTWTPAAACDGQGACVAATPVDCTPYVCDPASPPPRCRTDCGAGGNGCLSPAVCINGSCGARPKKADGAGCIDAGDCTSGFCQDGVCCDSACTAGCVSCNQAGFLGRCRPVASGKLDLHGACRDLGAAGCGSNGLCDGAGGCARYAAGTVCGAGSCSKGRVLRAPRHCDGQGACVTVADIDCDPYRCDPASSACFTACTGDLQCRRTCVGGSCQ